MLAGGTYEIVTTIVVNRALIIEAQVPETAVLGLAGAAKAADELRQRRLRSALDAWKRRADSAAVKLGVTSLTHVEAILAEQLADDLPVSEHMLVWSEADVRAYCEAGGFWAPDEDRS